MVVGTIHYDSAHPESTGDKGVLLYFKPAMTGDEPVDVRQYKSRNDKFPNESTVDQFYDEAQWEAYRRLGQHAAHAALDFVQDLAPPGGDSLIADDIFIQARWRWYPTPPELPGNMLELTDRYVKLEETLRATAPTQMIAELYPEAQGSGTWTGDATAKAVHSLVELLQVMEDTFFACQLEDRWNHPLNSGWMNTFHRWSAAPIFCYWWPILKGMYSDAFREFVERQLGVESGASTISTSGLCANWTAVPMGLAKNCAPVGFDSRDYEYSYGECSLPATNTIAGKVLQVCLLRVKKQSAEPRVIWTWSFEDLFVLPHLRGLGLGTLFLQQWIAHLSASTPGGGEMRVTSTKVGATRQLLSSAAARAEWSDDLLLYKRLGFQEHDGEFVRRF
jgi:GNAT superfamily N-acetyltransferase